MKKLLLITFLLTPFIALIAQPTITSSINGGIGDEFNYIDVQTEGLNPGPAGENVTWDFSDTYGWDPDLNNGTGGNNMAIQLVMDGLKLGPCNPGFIDGRDAILEADRINNGGINQCLIWNTFARRGLGMDAKQGDPDSWFDGTEGEQILNKYIQGNKDVFACQEELIEGGFEEYARL